MTLNKPKIAFFGTPDIAVIVLEELKKADIIPNLIVTAPDKPKGRKLVMTPLPVKVWAFKNNIIVIQPKKLDDNVLNMLNKGNYDLFIVASYGKILKKELIEIPKYKTINMHPSLLPKLRGASPIISAILQNEKKTGITIMLIDEGMDSGPILKQKVIDFSDKDSQWPLKASVLGKILATEGGKMLTEIIPKWIAGEIKPETQDHKKATFTQKIKKEDGLINLEDEPYKNLLKIRAFEEWPTAYFFTIKNNKKIRVKITDAIIENDKLKIKKVIPEGKKQMDYEDFLR
ncbi:methionyl-tRNA formyltransferase [Candidatus Campbellbacteria bacterium CG10_big_fil_rev_8_21_14_0_10_35_52]|uniref:methionyl-tRNA formyltransferase n=1 Tax=Candidatus Campbellbacteria bacterium CG10_big_fil_rev_8_21_14_0_10_35_52 TaxID=1974527 RepID=A0A2M6WV96_9BACT|nr:MAG: methionyl-tRNA formyltransferase [Candidatus Campbellbacteria bacterium CG10_big_fil_rev_8_21_14_0_10_35_52]